MQKNFNNINAPLQESESFEGKIDAIIQYLYIGTIYCTVDKNIRAPIRSSKPKYKVKSIQVRSGTPEYLLSYLNTSWKYLEQTLETELEKEGGFFNTRKALNECKSKIYREIEKYNFKDNYTYEAIHSVSIISKTGIYPALRENMIFKPKHFEYLRMHCLARISFLTRLLSFVDSKLNSIINLPEIQSSPYEWNSNKEIEITELLYALRLSGRIKIKEGTELQFREKFFNFFGLHDKDYNKRTKDIRDRKIKAKFLRELAEEIDKAE